MSSHIPIPSSKPIPIAIISPDGQPHFYATCSLKQTSIFCGEIIGYFSAIEQSEVADSEIEYAPHPYPSPSPLWVTYSITDAVFMDLNWN